MPRTTQSRRLRRGAALAAPAVLALLGASPAFAAEAPFRAAPDIALGGNALPRSVAVGDFDSDGRQDLAIADTGRNSVRVQLGRGDGSFAGRQEIAEFYRPLDVAVADFDADGVEDLAVAGFASADRPPITILRGTGDGRFTARVGFTVPGARPVRSIAVGDFNGDGIEDFAAVSDLALSTRLGQGDGTFAGGVDQVIGDAIAGAVRVEDFSGDGLDDVALTLHDGPDRLSVLTSKGDGAFAPEKLAALPSRADELATGDFDEDAKPDVVASLLEDNRVALRLGNGDGTLRPGPSDVPVGARPHGIAVGDFDGDGHEDLAIADTQAAGVSVRLGNGDATFRDGGETATGPIPTHLAAGDFDGDGSEDLAIAAADAGAVNVRLGTSAAPLAGNLLVNGGFEQGFGVQLPGPGPEIPGWTTTGAMTFARYGAHPHRGFPSWLHAARWSGGRNLLWGGPGSSTSAAQVVDVASETAAIDAGRATARLSAELGGGVAVPDTMDATAEFLDAGGAGLGSMSLTPVSAQQRRNTTTLLRRQAGTPMPAGTRRIRVTLTSRASAAVSSALADNVALTLEIRPPEAGGDQPGGGGAAR